MQRKAEQKKGTETDSFGQHKKAEIASFRPRKKRVIGRFGSHKKKIYPKISESQKRKRYPDISDALKKAGFLSAATVGCSSEAWTKQGKPQISQSLKRTVEQRANREETGLFGGTSMI